mmetsp:Transcript_7815/g.19139  ORF Transcript_7815/g.19139 Transcript_7815/m.19139 type:complete len:407 (+) Transcript_7815:133-1353(+)|eukprot:CAMPEP_0116083054 /NCGR_PEP_ID=MMETSP0327-20121206/3063_1 /TAXON_ID=44447 /ORGANISM="Pseudo-nitzschia delicatissima, Strain B596" /LENGTH=406 /DNA_ID=CAMNT_0003573905 /DNA_START=98 /DNA_END=1318 /DNA_ORIENTATION=-
MASDLCYERDESDSHERPKRQQGLHHSCTKKTLLKAAFLVCLSAPAAAASSRHIPSTRGVSRSSSNRTVRSFLSPRRRSESGHPALVSSAALESPTSSSLRLTSPQGDESEIPPLVEDDETSVTTTSFFKLPSETTGTQAPQAVESRQKTVAQLGREQPRPTEAYVQRSFVISLMGIAGFVEGFCLRRHGCFPNLMTGTILKVAEAIGSMNFSTASIHASMVACYMGGGFLFSRWKSSAPSLSNNREQTKACLAAVSALSGVFLLLSDVLGGIPMLRTLKLPLLTAAFGIINTGTVDVGAGVTYALTGHVAKVGQGLATSGFAKPSDTSKTSPSRTSAQGMVAFFVAALLANLACGVLEATRSGPLTLVLEKLPLGTTLLVAYASLFRWYTKASERVSAPEGSKNQ